MSSYRLRILHLSDLHEQGFKEGEHWRRRRVLGRAWEDNLDALRAGGAIDLVCFTGDTAERGLVEEFRQATDFFLATLDRLGVPEQRFFPVPGNHDMQRDRNTAAWRRLRSELTPETAAAYSAWLAGGETPKGGQRSVLEAVLGRQANYRHWLQYGLGRPDLLPDPSCHPCLGYRRCLELPGLPFPVQVIGLDSAWLCGDHQDPGRLWLTAGQVECLCGADDEPLAGFRLALLHHPLEYLADSDNSGAQLLERTDLLLRGHLHGDEAEAGPVTLRQLSTGCLYQRELHPHPPCACQVIEVTLDPAGRPRQYDLRFRRWSPAAGWFDDNSRHPGTREGRLHWWVGGRAAGGAADDPSAAVFVGRDQELATLGRALFPEGDARPTVCCVQGIPGVGKSFLVDRFFELHQSRFPGGYLRLVLDLFESPSARDLALGLLDRLELPVGNADPLALLRERLGSPATLVNIDNVDTREQAGPVLELVESLGNCAVIVSGRLPKLGLRAGWEQLPLAAFDADTAVQQLSEEVGTAQDGHLEQLVRTLGCLPLTVHLAAGHLRAGRNPLAFLEFLRAHGLNPETGAESRAGSPELTRAVLVTVLELSLDLLRSRLGPEAERLMAGFFALSQGPAGGFGAGLGAAAAGLSAAEFEELIDRAHELSLLDQLRDERSGRTVWRLHRLLAEMLRLRCSEPPVLERISAWFLARLGVGDADPAARQRAWREVDDERGSLAEWLGRLPEDYQLRTVALGAEYIGRRGPFQTWVGFLGRVLAQELSLEDRCRVLQALSRAALQGGLLDIALQATEELCQREIARAWGRVAEVLAAKGEHDQALAIRRAEELPVYQRLHDARCQAEVQSRIVDSLMARGDLDGAMALLQDEVLPVLARPQDARERADIQGRIAEVLALKGGQEQALRLYEEQLPVYEHLGMDPEQAATLGRIADLLFAQGRWDEALAVRRDRQLPLYERLGDARELTVCRTKLGILYLVRSDRKQAGETLCSALKDARRLGLREASQIDEVLKRAGIVCDG